MRFLSNGDFIFPLRSYEYVAQHIFMWSYEHGAPNPNGIMRMPGRALDILVFALFGNLGGAYFYVFSCLVVAFLAFWWFARSFLGADRRSTAFIGALFFTLNPIFLGNLSKVGLILAVAMLPLTLTVLKLGFQKKRFGYFLIFILAMNISLLHPFTFSMNLIISLGYLVILGRKQLSFLRDKAWQFGLLGIVALLLNAYFILPLASLRTLDKSSLSNAVASSPVDHTNLVDIANTGDILTGMSLSKGVLKDYEFYGAMTWPFYFLGILLFYILLIGTYLAVEKRIKPYERRRFVLALGVFLGLLVLATASYLYADVLIKFLIGLPGGWAFRAPLKWQLYMPVVLFMALVIVLKNVRDARRLKLLYVGLGLCFLLMNGYLFKQIYERLLTPRSLTHFAALERSNIDHKSLLFVDSATCFNIAQNFPALATELNQVFISKPLQVKHVQAGDIDRVNLGQYDLVMGCSGAVNEALLTKSYDFVTKATFAGGKYILYENRVPVQYVSAATQIFALKEPKEVGGKYALAKSLGQPFNFVADSDNHLPAVGVQDLFENLSPKNITAGRIHSSVAEEAVDPQLLIKDGPPLFFARQGNKLEFSTVSGSDMRPAPETISLSGENNVSSISYSDPSFTYANLIGNPSFESGTWQERVGDCNAYDDKPSLTMRLNRQTRTEGLQSLEMSAQAHIACTGPDELPVEPGQHYLLSFDYRSTGDRNAGYHAGFDDLMGTSTNARLPDTKGEWKSFNTEIIAPLDAKQLRLQIYAYADKSLSRKSVAGYDNFKLIAIPDVLNRFFVLEAMQPETGEIPKVTFRKLNPTKTQISIKNARNPFYLITKESYHRLWRLGSNGHELANHVTTNATMNGWYIEPTKLCSQIQCAQDGTGSYDFELTMEFTPQRWFYIGSFISGATAVSVMLFLIYDLWQARRKNER